MAYWLPQLILFATFALVSASMEYRRTGLILVSFAALYLGLSYFNTALDALSPPLYVLLYAVMDFAAMWLVFLFGSKGNKAQAVILGLFVLTHIAAWQYASGIYSLLDPQRYVVLTRALALLQILVILPGIKDGAHEVFQMVQKTLARGILHYRAWVSPDRHLMAFSGRIRPVCGGGSHSGGSPDSDVLHAPPVAGGQDGGAL